MTCRNKLVLRKRLSAADKRDSYTRVSALDLRPGDIVLVEAGNLIPGDGEDALWQTGSINYDVIVLDLMLPGVDGLTVLARLRAAGSRVPVLVLTARDSSAEKVGALNTGADDYLTKPFTFAELLARIRAATRAAFSARAASRADARPGGRSVIAPDSVSRLDQDAGIGCHRRCTVVQLEESYEVGCEFRFGAEAESVVVAWDHGAARSRPLTDMERAAFAREVD